MLIIKLSCTVNSKYIFDSKYEMGFKLLNVKCSKRRQSLCHKARLNGNMHFICAFYTVYFLFHKNQIALLKLQKIPLDLTVTLFTNYDMQDSLDFFHCMINHKQTYPMLSTSSRREADFP